MTSRPAIRACNARVLSAFLIAMSAATAWGSQPAVQITIEPQPLATALQSFSTQSGLQVGFESKLTKGLKSHGTQGAKTAADALEALLNGTELEFHFVNDQTVVIRERQSRQTAGAPPAHELRLVQDQSSSAVQEDTANQDGSAGSPQAEASKQTVSEIVVTAQRREESLQNVPIAISVLGGDELDSSTPTGAIEALRSVPGFDSVVGQYGGGSAFFSLRGVSNGARSGGSGTVAFYVDGIPYGFVREAYYPNPNIYDLDRIEVLSGPQGTLYGANALNGVVRILTKDANADRFEFKARALVSATEDGGDNNGADLAVNVPIVQGKLGVRAVLGYRDESGWIDGPTVRDLNTEETRNYRLKVHAAPSDTLSIDLSAWRSENDIGAPPLSGYDRRISYDVPQSGTTQFDTFGVEINKAFSAFSISSMSSWIDYGSDSIVYGGPAGVNAILDTQLDSSVFSQEINLVSSIDGPWRWSTGVFYRDAEDSNSQFLRFFPLGVFDLSNNNFSDSSESFAVYGEVARRLLDDQIDLAVGLRYFHDEETTLARRVYSGPTTVPAGASFESTSEAVTPRAILTWMPSGDRTYYVSYSQGFRSGFAQQPNVQAQFPFRSVDPDRLTNYEIGSKGSFGQLGYEAAVFFIDWQDIQQNLLVVLPTGLNTSATINGESASGLGASFGLSWAVLRSWKFGLNVSWNDLSLDADVRNAANALVLEEGGRLGFSPEWTVGSSAEYSRALGGGYTASAALSGSWKSPQNTQVLGAGAARSDDILIANARLSLEAPANWTASLFVDNLTDENGAVGKFTIIPEWATSPRPRVIGAELAYRF